MLKKYVYTSSTLPAITKNKNLKIGEAAPCFLLTDERGRAVSLAEFKGKMNVVLIFYQGDMAPACSMQLCAIRDDWQKFQRANAAVLGISHGDAESHKKFRVKFCLPFPLLTDKRKRVSEKYGTTACFLKAKIIKRAVVVVDKDGKIVYLRRGMPKNAEILKALR